VQADSNIVDMMETADSLGNGFAGPDPDKRTAATLGIERETQ
jgi:hypothetical protein